VTAAQVAAADILMNLLKVSRNRDKDRDKDKDKDIEGKNETDGQTSISRDVIYVLEHLP
jgi:hypothetical protein